MLNHEIKETLDHCVLIWLASIGEDGTPNVSPKEIFAVPNETTLLIANIASPQSVRNIKQNPKVCIGFINIFSQRGFKLNGTAQILEKTNPAFAERVQPLEKIANGLFVVQSIIEIQVARVAQIVAPRYKFYEDTTETAQVARAVKRYNRVLERFKLKLEA